MISSDTQVVKVSHIEKALTQIFTGTRVTAIKYVLKFEFDES